MQRWLGQLRDDLDRIEADDLLRVLRSVEPRGRSVVVHGRELVNLASNDYLGLSSHPHLRRAATEAIAACGTGSGASRLVAGHHRIHDRVECRFAAFKHAEAALLLPTGYMANLAVLTALAGKGDLICIDKLSHASLLDAAHASGAQVRAFGHLNHDKLERLLQRHADLHTDARRFVVTDTVFSMDGDTADLPTLCGVAERYEAIVIVDEAHGTGVLGDSGSGLCEQQHVVDRVPVVVSTAGKALGGLGGIVTGPRVVIDTLINRARSFIFTTAVPPAQAAAIDAALDVIRDEPQRRRRVIDLANRVRRELRAIGWLMNDPHRNTVTTPIVPIITGTASDALRLSEYLRNHGLFVPAIRPPTVAPGTSRLRLSLRADLDDADVDRLLDALRDCPQQPARQESSGVLHTLSPG
ncbi:MAG: 8-amino-7-oxononanoate synthase [Phycisphaeraceae bacterium]